MIRRAALTATALILCGGLAAPAFAAVTDTASTATSHGVCVFGGNSNTGSHDGICVWIPTN